MITETEVDELYAKRLALNDKFETLQFMLNNIIDAWDSLKPGSYDKDIWETWLIQKVKPAIDRARLVPRQNKREEL